MNPSDDERDQKRTNFTLVRLGSYENTSILTTPQLYEKSVETQINNIITTKNSAGFSISFSFKKSNEEIKSFPL